MILLPVCSSSHLPPCAPGLMVIMCSSCSNFGFRFCSFYDQIRVHNIRLVQICRNAKRGEEWNFTSKKSFGQGESTLLWIQLCAKDGGLTKWFNIDYGLPRLNHQIVVLFVGFRRFLCFSLSNNLFHTFPQPHLEFLPEKLTAICKANFMNQALQAQQPHCCSGLRP